MTHVVCEPCYDCKYTDCVTVCPVDCFYQDDVLLYIHPEDCIDCEACVPECPVEAIFAENAIPGPQKKYIQINADKAIALKNADEGHMTQDSQQEPKKGPGCSKIV